MSLHRVVNLSWSLHCRRPSVNFLQPLTVSFAMASAKYFSSHSITPNLILNTVNRVSVVKDGAVPRVTTSGQQPLLLLLEYMNAKEKHVNKFVEFYINHGFDVLKIHLKPWQLLWPVKGSQIVAKDIAEFLNKNNNFSPLVIHAFSVGGYLWGEVLYYISQNQQKYPLVADRIQAQVFDSVVDIDEIPVGFPNAVFPTKPVLKATFEKYIRYHMKTFYNESTKHYVNSRAAFASGIVRAPTLFIYSEKDPLSTPDTNGVAKRQLEELNIKVQLKCFEKSNHVMHYQMYKEDYLAEVETFLSNHNMLQQLKLKAKL